MLLDRKARAQLKALHPGESYRLFNAVWKDIREFNQHCDIDDLPALYDQIVSSKVNNSNSSFYIYG